MAEAEDDGVVFSALGFELDDGGIGGSELFEVAVAQGEAAMVILGVPGHGGAVFVETNVYGEFLNHVVPEVTLIDAVREVDPGIKKTAVGGAVGLQVGSVADVEGVGGQVAVLDRIVLE